MKILVCIANYGTKNDKYLSSIITEYRKMRFSVHLIILSNINKSYGKDIENVVGLPKINPWSLPFGHKKIFYENSKNYDLFIYSEDDTLIKENNIQAFMKVTKVLPSNEIAGFLRYEKYENRDIYYTTVHSHYHWDPKSIKKINEFTFAYFTNEHSACFLLTKKQLKKAINSGGFMKGPREGRYDMLCTAATDPYTQCGFKKVICISHINEFSLHHLPNVYKNRLGVSKETLDIQIERMLEAEKGLFSREQLFKTVTKMTDSFWDKQYYEKSREDVINLLPKRCKNILSIGCGWGKTEKKIIQRGSRITGIPIDSVIAACAEKNGIITTYPNFKVAQKELKHYKFDCLMFMNVLEYMENPQKIFRNLLKYLNENGVVIIVVINIKFLGNFKNVRNKREIMRKIFDGNTFSKTGIHNLSAKTLKKWIKEEGLNNIREKYQIKKRYEKYSRIFLGTFEKYLSQHIYILAEK